MKRVLSSVVILLIVLLIFLVGNIYIVDIFTSIVAVLCLHEIFKAFKQKAHNPVTWIGYLAAISISFIHIIPREYILTLIGAIIVVSILILFALAIIGKSKVNVLDIAITFFCVCYIVLFLMFMPIIRGLENGVYLIWYIFIVAWLTDVCAYTTGKTIGKHHFTEISPNKTIEGCIGGIIGAILAMLLYTLILNKFFGFNISYLIILFASILLSLIGQLGDLAASAIKRYCGIKDFSHLIPGHGGMLDRIDSMIFIAPFAYYLLFVIL